MNPPTVSVVMLVYNGERFVRAAIESILQQTYSDFELLIINDGSTDGTLAILEEYAARDSRIRVHIQPQNVGLAKCRNLGLELAAGKYIAVMDADDISLPQRLEKQVAYLDAHPETGVLGASAWIINEAGQRQEVIRYPASHHLICWSLYFYDPIINPVVMLRTDLARAAGGYREEYPPTEDYDLWARLSQLTHLENFPEILLLLRKHGGNITVTKRKKNLEQSAKISRALFKKLIGIDLPITPIELAWEPRRIPAGELHTLVNAILRLRNHFFLQAAITASEKKSIRRETALQLFRLLRSADSGRLALHLLFHAISIDPFALPTAMRLALQKSPSA